MKRVQLHNLPWWKRGGSGILKLGEIPQHIAFLTDGHRRFARKEKITKLESQTIGWDNIMHILTLCLSLEIKEVTMYLISTNNLQRTDAELLPMWKLALSIFGGLFTETETLQRQGIQVKFIGNHALLPEEVQQLIAASARKANQLKNPKLIWYVISAYTSRQDITAAIKDVLREEETDTKDIDEDLIEKHLSSGKYIRPIDFVVRTSGETRLSDFFLWHIGDAVIHFVDVLWPDFTTWGLWKSILYYQFVKAGQGKQSMRQLEL